MEKMKSPEYVAKHGQVCPYCGSDSVAVGPDTKHFPGKIEEERDCLSCNTTWVEMYVLAYWREGSFINE